MSSTEVTTQTPAGWVALSVGDRHLVVQGSAAMAEDLRGPLEAGFVEVLEALSRDGLRALPDFALADTSGERTRVVVRGSAVVRADGDEVSADGRMPWRDLDTSAAALELAGPGGRAGWKRPRRLGRAAAAGAGSGAAAGAGAGAGSGRAAATPPAEAAPDTMMEAGAETSAEPEEASVADVADVPDVPDVPEAVDAAEPESAPDQTSTDDAVDDPADAVEPAADSTAEAPLSPAALAPPVPPPADLTLPPSEEYAGAAPAERVTPAPQPKAEKKVLIDSVPWRTLPDADGGASAPAAASSTPEPAVQDAAPSAPEVPDVSDDAPSAPAAEPADGPTGPDNWGLTGPPPTPPGFDDPPAPAPAAAGGMPTTEAMPVPGAEPEPSAAPAPPVPDVTMDRSSLNPAADGPADSPIVLAVICPAGHHSSPHASTCRVCGRDIPTQQPFQTPRPQLGVFRVSTGGLVPLDRGILLGRSPKVNSDLPPSSRPHLVRLASRDNDISRNHAEVILEGWHVLVRDLGSTNGTTVTLPGQEPVRLRPTEDFGIEPGAIVTLADEVALTYEVAE
ncbi:FHA domain-containing protein [Knoellia sp. LjRoot47]|uniref:FHA domain-containing protein n=1 Tax=Knoellia sp. LjRoot47 TaxID=3342330 RepID=UPI003ECC8545